jgi:hypothetical protein
MEIFRDNPLEIYMDTMDIQGWWDGDYTQVTIALFPACFRAWKKPGRLSWLSFRCFLFFLAKEATN